MIDRIPTDLLVTIAPSADAPAPTPAASTAPTAPIAAPASTPTTPLPALPPGDRAQLAAIILADRLVRGWPTLALGAALALALAALAWVALRPPAAIGSAGGLLPAGRASELAVTPTPPLVVPTPPAPSPLPTAAPAAPAPVVVVVEQAPPPPAPEPQIIYVVEQAPPPPAPTPVIVVEPAGDGGTWLIAEEPGGRSVATYQPPADATPVPTPYYGGINGGGGGFDD